jgi:F-type H+-transporting ATPase subunit delta
MNNNPSKYAKVLFDSCSKSELLSSIQNELSHIEYLFTKTPVFRLVLITKRINNENKVKIISNALKDFNPITIEFLSTIINNNQSNELSIIIHRFNRLVNMQTDIKSIDIITAQQMDQSYLQSVVLKISSNIKTNPNINNIVDENIIGGMKLRIGNKIFDNSVNYQLNQLKKTLHNR